MLSLKVEVGGCNGATKHAGYVRLHNFQTYSIDDCLHFTRSEHSSSQDRSLAPLAIV